MTDCTSCLAECSVDTVCCKCGVFQDPQPATVWLVVFDHLDKRDTVESAWSTQDKAESAADVARARYREMRFRVVPFVVDEMPAYQQG